MAGVLTFKPALKNGGTAAETVVLSGHVAGCEGDTTQFSKTINTGTIHATGTIAGNDCAAYLTNGKLLPALNGTIRWSPVGIAPTVFNYSGVAVAADFNNNGVFVWLPDPQGTGTATSGSFAGPISPVFTQANQDAGVLFKKCQKTGVPSLTFGGNITLGS